MIYYAIFKQRAWGKLRNKSYLFGDLIYLLLDIILFTAIYAFAMEDENRLAGMTFHEIATYLVFSITFFEITQMNGDKLANKVFKDRFLFEFLKPYSYRGKVLSESAADFFTGCVTKLLPITLLLGLLGYFHWPSGWLYGCMFVISLMLGAAIWCNVELFFQLMGFWCKDMFNVFFIIKTVYWILGGGLVLYCFLPKLLCQILKCTPLYYVIAFPMDIYLGRVDAKWMIGGLIIQIVWIAVLVYLEKIIFGAGRRKLQRAD